MKKSTKFIALVLVLTMCVGLFAGCNSNADEQQGTNPPATEGVNAETTPATEPPVLTNAEIYPLSSDKTFTVATNKDANEYDTTKLWEHVTGVEVDYLNWSKEQVSMALASKEMPDAFYLTVDIDKTTAYEYGEAGYFINFMDYLDIMPNFSALIAKNPDVLRTVQNEDGSVYALPKVGYTNTAHGDLLFIRTDMMNAAGWDELPQTTDEFLQCIKDIQAHYGADDPEFVAFDVHRSWVMQFNGFSSVTQFFFPSFGDLMETGFNLLDDGSVTYGAATEQYKHYLEFMNAVYTSGAFSNTAYTEDGTQNTARVSNNQVAVCSNMGSLTEANFASGKVEVEVLAPLTSEYSDTKKWLPTADVTWMSNIITSSCQDVETMVKWFDSFYATEENPLNEEGTVWGWSMWLGELGVDYALDKENMTYEILPHEGYDNPSDWHAANASGNLLMAVGFDYSVTNRPMVKVKGDGSVNNLYPYAVSVVRTSQLTLTQDESDDYSDIYTDIEGYVQEMTAKFITGEEDIATGWDSYVANLEKMGVADAEAIYEAAYARYLAN